MITSGFPLECVGMDGSQRLIECHKNLMRLRQSEGFHYLARREKFAAILRMTSEMLDAERVSIWLLDPQGSAILCELLYIRATRSLQDGLMLKETDFPAYFSALKEDRLIVADDARHDIRTSAFADTYLKPLDIYALLDAPIFAAGKLTGVVCVEHTGSPRKWSLADMSCVAAVADTVTLMNEHELWIHAREESEFFEKRDALTGLENRVYFQQRIDADIESDPLAPRVLVVIGIDRFKDINDKHGHDQADQLLRQFASKLVVLSARFESMGVSRYSSLARVGGDLFAYWLPTPKDRVDIEKAISLIQSVVAEPIITRQGNSIDFNCSIGIFSLPHEGMVTLDPLRGAELALQDAKKKGSGTIGHFSGEWFQKLAERKILEDELRSALHNGEIRAYYQPIVDQKAGAVGIEALVRWQHPYRGLLGPGMFLPIVIEAGLMGDLSRLMVRQACADISMLRQRGFPTKWVSVNLTADLLFSDTLIIELHDLLMKHQLPGSCLEFEIVEDVIGQDSTLLMSRLNDLASMGVGLAIDDFGTGYSSLSRLKHLPVEKLKIDKSFVDGLPKSQDDQSITRSIVALAKSLNLKLVAEGVEREEQALWLRAEQIDYLQGYLFAKPMDINALCRYLTI